MLIDLFHERFRLVLKREYSLLLLEYDFPVAVDEEIYPARYREEPVIGAIELRD